MRYVWAFTVFIFGTVAIAGLSPSTHVVCCQEINASNNVSSPTQCTMNATSLNASQCPEILADWEETQAEWLRNTQDNKRGFFDIVLSYIFFW